MWVNPTGGGVQHENGPITVQCCHNSLAWSLWSTWFGPWQEEMQNLLSLTGQYGANRSCGWDVLIGPGAGRRSAAGRLCVWKRGGVGAWLVAWFVRVVKELPMAATAATAAKWAGMICAVRGWQWCSLPRDNFICRKKGQNTVSTVHICKIKY